MSQDLLETLDRDPENEQTWLIYADHLAESGHPRGELIAVDHALATASEAERPALTKRRKQLYARHGPALLGPVGSQAVKSGFLKVEWKHGFVIRVAYVGNPGWRHLRAVDWLVSALEDESYRFVREIDLSYTDFKALPRLPARHLETLVLAGCPLTDLSSIGRFGKLRHLDIRFAQVADLTPLQEAATVQKLDLGRGPKGLRELKENRPELTVKVHARPRGY